jgi:hypothetical protein
MFFTPSVYPDFWVRVVVVNPPNGERIRMYVVNEVIEFRVWLLLWGYIHLFQLSSFVDWAKAELSPTVFICHWYKVYVFSVLNGFYLSHLLIPYLNNPLFDCVGGYGKAK